MRARKLNLPLSVLAGLLFLSLAFFTAAQENSNNSNNVFLDSDQDGLTDQEERAYGTDARDTDSDNDGYSDGAEVKAGYNPLKPAPGDKIVSAETAIAKNENSSEKNNLTEDMAQKISIIVEKSVSEDQEITIEEIQSMVDESLSGENLEEEIPQISRDEIKIKKQNYSKLSDEKAEEKRKEDFTEYIAAVYYILSSNSPEPITSLSDINQVLSSFTSEIIYALNLKSSSSLDNLSEISENSLEQLKKIEVPEELVDLHIKALRFALYAQNLKSNIDSEGSDPMKDIVKLSKVQVFVENLISFSAEAEQKFEEYGIDNDDAKEILSQYGIKLDETE